MKKRYVISVLAVLTVTTGLGQGARRYIAAAYGSGFLVAHRSSMRHLIQGHSSTFELSYLSEPIGVSAGSAESDEFRQRRGSESDPHQSLHQADAELPTRTKG